MIITFFIAMGILVLMLGSKAFEIKVHKRLVEIVEPTDKTIDSLMHLELPAGVDIEVKM